jgi:hypothetical protein
LRGSFGIENEARPCDNQSMTKAELHELVDRLPDGAVDGAAIILGEFSDGRIDPEQAWFWTSEWQAKELEADDDLVAGRVTHYESDEGFLAALDERGRATFEYAAEVRPGEPHVIWRRIGTHSVFRRP